jgi:uncharacterized protein YjbI with pentapeptide repeats
MISKYTHDIVFNKEDFASQNLVGHEFDNCKFIDCSFQACDLSKTGFMECEFSNCDFSLAKLQHTAFKDVVFSNCKLLGMQFTLCNTFLLSLRFVDCVLDLSSFFKLPLKAINFIRCSLKEVDFVEANLSSAVFEHCDLSNAIFERSNLEKADFSTAVNYQIDPELNKINNAQFSQAGLMGLLYKYNIKVH